MLTAKEAKEKSEVIYCKLVDKDYLELLTCIETQITEATKKGEFSLTFFTSPKIKLDAFLKTVETLRNLGYDVNHINNCNIRKIYVNWSDA